MGNKQLQQTKGQLFQHPRLGRVKLIQLPDQRGPAIQYTIPITHQKLVSDWLIHKKLFQNDEARQIFFLSIDHTFQKQGLCGSSGILKLVYQQYIFLLQNQIKNRHEINRPFLQTQMWYLIYNMIRAGNQYQKYKLKIGDVQPSNVVINQDGQIKIISSGSWPSQGTNFERAVEYREAKTYLAPEQCNQSALKRGQYPQNINPNVAQVFSIGATLLEASTLEDCEILYIKSPQYKFNNDALRKLLDVLMSKYSNLLFKVIGNMVEINPTQRPTCAQLYNVFLPYQNSILNLQEFVFDKNLSQKSYINYIKSYPKNNNSQWQFNRLFQIKTQIRQSFTNQPRQFQNQSITKQIIPKNGSEMIKASNYPQVIPNTQFAPFNQINQGNQGFIAPNTYVEPRQYQQSYQYR